MAHVDHNRSNQLFEQYRYKMFIARNLCDLDSALYMFCLYNEARIIPFVCKWWHTAHCNAISANTLFYVTKHNLAETPLTNMDSL